MGVESEESGGSTPLALEYFAEPFREAFERAAVGMALVDLEGRPLETNPALREMLGYGPGEIRGMIFTEFTHPEDASKDMDLYKELVTGEREYYQVEKRYLKKGGEQMWGRLAVSLVREEGGHEGDGQPGRPLFAVALVEDITGRKKAEERLRLRERAITATHNGIIVTDALAEDDPIVYVNQGFERITGYAAEEVVGYNARFLQNDDYDQPALSGLRDAIRENREWSGTFRNYRKDGVLFWNQHNVSPVYDEEGRVVNHIGVVNDITERKELEDRLAHRALHDPLTDLPNRALFADRLGQALARGGTGGGNRRRNDRVAVLFADLDNFKYINDSLGHEAGDRLLIGVADRIRSILRPADTVARLGGDEFAILLEEVVDTSEAVRVAERLAEELKPSFTLGELSQEVSVSLSVGITVTGSVVRDSESLLRHADLAMYEAKRRGRSRHAVYEESMGRKAEKRLALDGDLRRALEGPDKEFKIYYQPEVSLESGRTVALEALVRWERPERGIFPPAEFIPFAEETGLIVEVGKLVLQEACRQAREWRNSGYTPLPVWVNLSALQLYEPELPALVSGALRESGLPPGSLGLEITESVLMRDGTDTITRLENLKNLGVKLAIDDFGTGYSSLAYLKRLPVDYLKIDRSFTDGLGRDAGDTTIVSAVLGIARAMELEVVAEGVETERQLAKLKELGCKTAQGYYFARPLPASTLPDAFLTTYPVERTRQAL